MKIMLVNGSPRANGCTYTALCEIEQILNEKGIETEIFHIGAEPIRGCTACGRCGREKLGKCAYDDDCVNTFIEKAKAADGFIFGSPVYFASVAGTMSAFMDRAFYSGKGAFAFKPAAGIVSCRRGGASASFDQLNKYFAISSMPIVGSQYWNSVHGNTPEEVVQDLEGMQTMRTLARNMTWLLRCIEIGKENGIDLPEREPIQRTNFVR